MDKHCLVLSQRLAVLGMIELRPEPLESVVEWPVKVIWEERLFQIAMQISSLLATILTL